MLLKSAAPIVESRSSLPLVGVVVVRVVSPSFIVWGDQPNG
jgi:hypothetical protein